MNLVAPQEICHLITVYSNRASNPWRNGSNYIAIDIEHLSDTALLAGGACYANQTRAEQE